MENAAAFQVQLRRIDSYGLSLEVRFQVRQGRGILSIGMAQKKFETSKTTAWEGKDIDGNLLRAGRFIHLATSGRPRQSYALSRLDPTLLGHLPAGDWVALVPIVEHGFRYLILDNVAVHAHVARVKVAGPPASAISAGPGPLRVQVRPEIPAQRPAPTAKVKPASEDIFEPPRPQAVAHQLTAARERIAVLTRRVDALEADLRAERIRALQLEEELARR